MIARRTLYGGACAALLVSVIMLSGCAQTQVNERLSMPDLAMIPDGTYTATARSFPVVATVRLSTSGGKITEFTILRHRTGKGQAAEALAGQIVARQSIDLDVVAGATLSSRVILKAGELALRSALPGEPK